MLKILNFAKDRWAVMLVILVLLFFQVQGELALPDYTSAIVDTGIGSRGIERTVPDRMSGQTFENLCLFLSEEDQTLLDSVYRPAEENTGKEKDGGENRIRIADFHLLSGQELQNVQDLLILPEAILYFLSSGSEEAEQMKNTYFPGVDDPLAAFRLLPSVIRSSLLEKAGEQMSAYPASMLESIAKRFVASEYEALGIDMERYQMRYLVRTGLRMLGITVFISLISILVGFLSARLAAGTSRKLRSRIFDKVIGFSNAEMNEFSAASLITRCTNDVQQIQIVLTMFFRVVLFAPIMGIGAVVRVMGTAVSMTWIIGLAVFVLLILILLLMMIAMPRFRIMQKLIDQLNLVAREVLTGLPVIRAFNRQEHEKNRFRKASEALYHTQLFTSRTMVLMMPTMMFLLNGVSVLIVWTGARQIENGMLQVGEMIAFLTYAMQIIMSFLMISMVSILLPRASVAAGRIEEVLNSRTQILDPPDPAALPEKIRGEIRFDHVSFRYPGAAADVLSDLNFTAAPGTTTAIIGGTGSGKSTLVHLIPRLYDVTEGSVTLDGIDIRNIKLSQLRKAIGFVPQRGFLFSGTIASNIRFGDPSASEDDVRRAARIAQAEEFISDKAMGYQSEISQGGTNVSGGQKQRLAIARAIARHPAVYIFDDSFSALDYKTDAALRKALASNMRDATVLIVAQRISTILHADRILVLDDGRIVGQGTHDELMKTCEVYRQIAVSQLSGEDFSRIPGKENAREHGEGGENNG